MESWIETFSGGKINPLNPDPDDIKLIDIAHALSLTCRYNGHCREFYSVAEHSVRLSRLVPEYLKRAALMHDAAEAYMSDLARPIKYNVVGYSEIESNLLIIIFEKYNINPVLMAALKHYDNKLLITEAMQLMDNIDGWGTNWPDPYIDYDIRPWHQKVAEGVFIMDALNIVLKPYMTLT